MFLLHFRENKGQNLFLQEFQIHRIFTVLNILSSFTILLFDDENKNSDQYLNFYKE